jgi:hypothetical protein
LTRLARPAISPVALGAKHGADGMPTFKTLRECWRSHGVTAKSVYDWTATDDPPTRVAMTFWCHEFDDPSLRVYRARMPKDGETSDTRPSFRKRIEHLSLAKDTFGGEVRVVLVTVRDPSASPWRIGEREVVNWRMRVVELDTATGNFRLESIEDSANA